MLTLNATHKGESETGKVITPGDVLEYLGHVPGGMIKVKFPDGQIDIAHPGCFKELR